MTTTALAALKQRLWAEIDRRRDELARLCADSLAVPAENPPGDTTAIADHFARILRHVGLGVERFEPRAGTVSLVSTQPGRGEHPRFVFNAHLDHFPSDDPSRWSFPPYGGGIRDGKILGRGSCDMRGGLTIANSGTDARYFRPRGVPTLVFGPRPHGLAAPDEYITVDDLVAVTKVHLGTALDVLRHDDAQ